MLRLAQTLLCDVQELQLFKIIAHITLALGGMVDMAFWYFELFIREPELHAAIVNLSFSRTGGKHEGARKWTEYTVQDIYALHCMLQISY